MFVVEALTVAPVVKEQVYCAQVVVMVKPPQLVSTSTKPFSCLPITAARVPDEIFANILKTYVWEGLSGTIYLTPSVVAAVVVALSDPVPNCALPAVLS